METDLQIDFFRWSRFFDVIPKIAAKFPVTFEIVFFSFAFGAILALLIAVVRIKKIPVLAQVVRVFISFERGTPMLVQLFLVYYILPQLIGSLLDIDTRRWSRTLFVIITFVLNEGAYLGETFRAAIVAVPKLQTEAALSCGLTGRQTFLRIILPQATRIAIPPTGLNLIGLFIQSSLVFVLGVMDMIGRAQAYAGQTGHALEAYIVVALFYIIVNIALRRGFAAWEGAHGNKS